MSRNVVPAQQAPPAVCLEASSWQWIGEEILADVGCCLAVIDVEVIRTFLTLGRPHVAAAVAELNQRRAAGIPDEE